MRERPFEAVIADVEGVLARTASLHAHDASTDCRDLDAVEVFEDAVATLDRWRRGGLKLAAVSSSPNGDRVLRTTGLAQRFDVIVDGLLARTLGLPGKCGIMLEAARRLDVEPADAVVLEDASAGVRVDWQDRFGLAIGVNRRNNGEEVSQAGANAGVERIDRLRFRRRLPSALDRLSELSAWRGTRAPALFLDYDGTLSPIVSDPRDAWLSDEMRATLVRLAGRWPVAIVSGRDRADVESRVGIETLIYAGNHGFDIAGNGLQRTVPEAERVLDVVHRAADELERQLGSLAGVQIERKRYSVAVHFRQVRSQSVIDEVERFVKSMQEKTSLRRRIGKKVFELEPDVDWDKGRALRWLIQVVPQVDHEHSFVVYIGDDETDEDAFAALGASGAAVRVGDEITDSLASYRLPSPREVQVFLRDLASLTP